MKAEAIVFTNTIPEVSRDGDKFKVDFGTVVLELTAMEFESLFANLLLARQRVGISRLEREIEERNRNEGKSL